VSYVYAAARAIARSLSKFTVVVTKSTVPVGASDEVERIMREENPGAEFAVVSNPEFLREGAAIRDFKHPDRIVIGTSDARARSVITEVSPEEVMRAGFHYCGLGGPNRWRISVSKLTFAGTEHFASAASGRQIEQIRQPAQDPRASLDPGLPVRDGCVERWSQAASLGVFRRIDRSAAVRHRARA
jgi:hypothetical protein